MRSQKPLRSAERVRSTSSLVRPFRFRSHTGFMFSPRGDGLGHERGVFLRHCLCRRRGRDSGPYAPNLVRLDRQACHRSCNEGLWRWQGRQSVPSPRCCQASEQWLAGAFHMHLQRSHCMPQWARKGRRWTCRRGAGKSVPSTNRRETGDKFSQVSIFVLPLGFHDMACEAILCVNSKERRRPHTRACAYQNQSPDRECRRPARPRWSGVGGNSG